MANERHHDLSWNCSRALARLAFVITLTSCLFGLSNAFDAVQITNAQTWCSRSRTSNSHHYSARSRFRRRLKHSDALRRTYDATTTPETTLRRNYIPNRRCCNLRRGSTANSAALGVRARGSQRCYARYPPLLEEEAGQDEEDCADAEDEAQVQASVSPSKKPKRRGWIKMMGKEGKEEEKSMLGKVGEGAKMTFNTVMGVSTLVSLLLAAEALWELRGTPLTLSNAVPTLTKLLPATGIGVFGAAQVVGLVARVARVIVTLPIMISGTWVILQNVPQLMPKEIDFRGPGSLVALLATPEVLEAAAVVALLGGTVLWAINFAATAVGWVMSPRDETDDQANT